MKYKKNNKHTFDETVVSTDKIQADHELFLLAYESNYCLNAEFIMFISLF